jgi:hypothetical protein
MYTLIHKPFNAPREIVQKLTPDHTEETALHRYHSLNESKYIEYAKLLYNGEEVDTSKSKGRSLQEIAREKAQKRREYLNSLALYTLNLKKQLPEAEHETLEEIAKYLSNTKEWIKNKEF